MVWNGFPWDQLLWSIRRYRHLLTKNAGGLPPLIVSFARSLKSRRATAPVQLIDNRLEIEQIT